MSNNTKQWLLFLAGSFSMTQVRVVGFLGITEVVFFILAPAVFTKNKQLLKKHGFNTALTMAMLWLCSALVTDLVRDNTTTNLLKGIATPYSVFAGIVCMHALLWDDITRYKWAVVGFACSLILSTYVIPYGTNVGLAEQQGIDVRTATKEYKLYAVMMVNAFLLLPVKVQYLKMPHFLNVGLSAFVSMFSLLEGARSAFLVKISSAWLILVGGQSAASMKNVRRYCGLILVSLLCVGLVAKFVYQYAVTKGYLGERELVKYQAQSESRIGILSGRGEFIPALMAVRDSPWIGHGSWAADTKGYVLRAQELVGGDLALRLAQSSYASGRYGWIPCHSYVWQAWVWHGVLGGIFWLYVFFGVFVKTFAKCLAVFPPLYGYYALQLPSEFWNVWFSPLGFRVEKAMLITLCLMTIFYFNKRKRMPDTAQYDVALREQAKWQDI